MEKIDTITASLARVLMSVLLLIVCLAAFPPFAVADGGVSLVRVWNGDRGLDAVDPAPADTYTVSLEFDKNVSFANGGDDTFVRENLGKVYVLDSSGSRVGCVRAYGASGRDERCVIYLQATDWLAPLASYTIVAEAGIRAGNGEDATDVEYRVPIKTSAECADGFTAYESVAFMVLACAASLGVVVTCARRAIQDAH